MIVILDNAGDKFSASLRAVHRFTKRKERMIKRSVHQTQTVYMTTTATAPFHQFTDLIRDFVFARS